MYEDIIDALRVSGEELTNQKKKSNHRPIAGWNDYCREAHSNARDAFLLWADNNKPRSGPIFDTMRHSRTVFKQAIRHCRATESRAHADSLARKLLARNPKQFWKEVQRMNGKDDVSLATTVGHATGQTNIADMWKVHYSELLNSTPHSAKKQTVLDKLGLCSSLNEPLTALEVAAAIKELKKNKACGLDHLQSEHFKFSCTKITVLLSLCFNAMLSHGHLSQQLMNTILVPIIKDKKGDVTDADNYQPIAITSVTSKLFETVFLTRFSSLLGTCDNQFGFKSSHSTDMCVFVLKQMIELYTSSSSPIFICYLDASKAFDRINFWVLFEKLLDRGISCIFVRFLMIWYCTQEFVVRWGNTYSTPFNVTNGLRQGGILSPILFNVYVNDLSNVLNTAGVGCTINGTIVNHLIYADDTVLIAPSARALQLLLAHCDIFATDCDIIYNAKKSVCMCIKPVCLKVVIEPRLVLSNNVLKYVSSYKYLGITICNDKKDDVEIAKQCRNLYARGNTVIRNFKQCSEEIKCRLFKSYCTGFYCSPLWITHSSESLRRIHVAFNRIFRILLNLESRQSMSSAFVSRGLNPFTVVIRKSVFSFKQRLLVSNNLIVKSITDSMYFISCLTTKSWNRSLYISTKNCL